MSRPSPALKTGSGAPVGSGTASQTMPVNRSWRWPWTSAPCFPKLACPAIIWADFGSHLTNIGSMSKILHVVAGAPRGGAETFSLDAIKALHDEGVDQFVLCRPHDNVAKALDERGIEYHPLTFNRIRKPFEKNTIANKINKFQPDLVHCWMSRASSFVPANTSVPVLGWFGGYYSLKYYKNCDFYMGVTKDIVRHIIDETNKPHRAFLVHTFGTLEASEPVTKAEFDIPEDAKMVLLLSRMHRKKGVDTLLLAAAELGNIYFLLAGDGPAIDEYKKLCEELNLNDRVRFLGWRNDRSALLNIADVCVLPSRYEPFGTVIAEAWYAGVPLVATKAAGAKQYVTHEKDGLLCEINDSETLANRIRTVLTDEKIREKLVIEGQNSYNTLFSKQVVISSLLSAYQSMIKTGKPAQPRTVAVDDIELPSSMGKPLKEAIRTLSAQNGRKNAPQEIEKVANAYLVEYKDATLSIDAAYIQASGLHNLIRKSPFKSGIEIFSEAEINTVLENDKILTGGNERYQNFTGVFR